MNKKINFLLFSLFATVLTFSYLTFHHYSLLFGLSSTSICQINQTFNCDTAVLSSYSEAFGIPIALWGLSFSSILFLVVLCIRIGWLEVTAFISHSLQILFLVAALISVGLGLISTFLLKVVCPFCFLSYLLNFINCILIFKIFSFDATKIRPSELAQHKGFLTTLIFIPFMAWFLSSTIQTSFGFDELQKIIPEKIAQWQQMPVQKFDLGLGLKKGVPQGKATIVEFADFKCPHCKAAAQTLKAFLNGNNDTTFIFKTFPLDGNCNPHVSFKGDGSRCQMAGLVLCSEKIAQKGWRVHDYFFENQENLAATADIKPAFTQLAKEININGDEIIKCSESSQTYESIRKMTDEAKAAQVDGTPAIFMNNQKLGHGQFLQVLKEAFKSLN